MSADRITTTQLLNAYRQGYFPMAAHRGSSELLWFDPPWRGILPLDTFHTPARLARTMRQNPYRLTINEAFGEVIRGCAEPSERRGDTWINAEIIALYTNLHEDGYAHSIEAWQKTEDGGETLVGGVYGIALGGAFFGESMFTRARDASKICLVTLVERLRMRGFSLLDTQFINRHLEQFGATEIPRAEYHAQLNAALTRDVVFP